MFYTAILISANLTCKPYAKLWDKTLPGNCSDNNEFDVATASYNLISDVLILLLPQRMIWRLHLETKKKIGIAVIFAIGIRYISLLTKLTISPYPAFPARPLPHLTEWWIGSNICLTSACIATAYRLYASIEYLERADATYGIANIALGTEAEVVCALLIFYVPTLPKAFKNARSPFRFLASVFSRLKSSTSVSHEKLYSNLSEHVESGLAHPHRTYIPLSILRTTQVSIDRGSDYGSTPRHFQNTQHY